MSSSIWERFSGWSCLFMEYLGIMPCNECPCFDSATLSCHKDGYDITHEALIILRHAYRIPDKIKIEVVDDDTH